MGRGLRGLMLYAAHLFDLEKKEGEEVKSIIDFLIPICKGFGTDEGMQMCLESIQVHGGYGYCTEYGVEQLARDVKIATIYEGTNGIQAIDFISRKVLKEEGKTLMIWVDKVQETLAKATSVETLRPAVAELKHSLGLIPELMSWLGEKAKSKQMEEVLAVANDFMRFNSHLLVNWVLLEQAILAGQAQEGASEADKNFYATKIQDANYYAQHFLTENRAIFQRIKAFSQVMPGLLE